MHLDALAAGAVKQGIQRLGAQVFDGGIQCKAIMLCKALIVHLAHRALGVVPAAGLDGALPDGELLVGDDELRVHPHEGAEAGAPLAGAEGVVEAEHPGLQLVHRHAVLRAGVALAELHGLPARHIHRDQPAGEGKGGLQAVGQAAVDVFVDDQTVHHDLHRVLFVLFQGNFLVEVVHVPVDAHPGVATPAGGVQFLLLGALAAAHHRRQHLEAGAGGQFQHGVTIWSTVCWLMTRPHTGQCGMPMRAYRRRR